jgi:hypothetical protein
MWAANRAIVAAGASERSFARRGIDYGGRVEVLWGRADRLVPVEHAGGVRAALPQARITVQDRMGHHPQGECPDLLAGFLERALARIERGLSQGATQTATPPRRRRAPTRRRRSASPPAGDAGQAC